MTEGLDREAIEKAKEQLAREKAEEENSLDAKIKSEMESFQKQMQEEQEKLRKEYEEKLSAKEQELNTVKEDFDKKIESISLRKSEANDMGEEDNQPKQKSVSEMTEEEMVEADRQWISNKIGQQL